MISFSIDWERWGCFGRKEKKERLISRERVKCVKRRFFLGGFRRLFGTFIFRSSSPSISSQRFCSSTDGSVGIHHTHSRKEEGLNTFTYFCCCCRFTTQASRISDFCDTVPPLLTSFHVDMKRIVKMAAETERERRKRLYRHVLTTTPFPLQLLF